MKKKLNNQGYNWISGIHPVKNVIKHGSARIKHIFVDPKKKDRRLFLLKKEALRNDIEVIEKESSELSELSGGSNHQGILAYTAVPASLGEKDLNLILSNTKGSIFLLILDGVTDPHNLGACLRAADGAGVSAVIAPRDNCVGLTPAVCKVASGAAETVPFVQVTNLVRTMRFLQDTHKVFFFGTSEKAEKELYEVDLEGPLGLVMGGEGKGVRRLTSENCDLMIKLPMLGALESLNVSVATGICLYEAVRQRSS